MRKNILMRGAAILPLFFPLSAPQSVMAAGLDAEACLALEGRHGGFPADLRIESADWRAAGVEVHLKRPPHTLVLPEHCEIRGIQAERPGASSQSYAIRFHLRLPSKWNNRFFFEGGGGTNGDPGVAVGAAAGAIPALGQGYAVVSQDSGHSNEHNNDPEHGGVVGFGLDPQARKNYGGASLKPVNDSARAIIRYYYGADPRKSYFYGCSKGGQEGMYLAQNFPDIFDGIVAAAPGFSLPRAAVAEAWDTQAFAAAAGLTAEEGHFNKLADRFTDVQFALVADAVRAACDGDDGLEDGIVGAYETCTTAKVLPKLTATLCADAGDGDCLTQRQIDAMLRTHEGPRNNRGEALYVSFPWDAGLASPEWRMWKVGIPGGIPAINVLMGAPSLATVFSTPPQVLDPGPQAGFRYHMTYDFDQAAAQIYATSEAFPRSSWRDIGARSADISAFAKKGGRMIVPHGVSDPVFSITDTTNWWREVDAAMGGKAAETVRVFPVPGMAHCGGGPATDQYDAFGALVRWVEAGDAPDRIVATAGPDSPWPGRARPLCPYPRVATYLEGGDPEKADSFVCQ